MTVQVRAEEVEETALRADVQNVQYHHADYDDALGATDDEQEKLQPLLAGPKIGRNDPCPCGSGKKYKQCHGKLSNALTF
ncbi:MAG: SEC-C domain-containing protein [Deltaproteobacteria bacterium]|nr:SEC-C domain-containing protein [Deltaproteobacteria bacterium]